VADISPECPADIIGICIKDHVVPLACGGPDTVSNIQWQTTADGKSKDKWERKGCKWGITSAGVNLPHR